MDVGEEMHVPDYWLDRARDGDEIAMEKVLAAAEPFVREFVQTHVPDRHDAEEVVQECLVSIWQSIGGKKDRIRNFEDWCSRIIWRRINDYYRRSGRDQEIAFSDFFGGLVSPDGIDEVVARRGIW